MFGGLKRLREPYERKVATALIHERVDSLILEELRAIGALAPGSQSLRMLAELKLAPGDAALAITLASHRYIDERMYARWLSRVLQHRSSNRPEDYFLELLHEAIEAIRLRH